MKEHRMFLRSDARLRLQKEKEDPIYKERRGRTTLDGNTRRGGAECFRGVLWWCPFRETSTGIENVMLPDCEYGCCDVEDCENCQRILDAKSQLGDGICFILSYARLLYMTWILFRSATRRNQDAEGSKKERSRCCAVGISITNDRYYVLPISDVFPKIR